MKKLLVILGPTATGKTDLAIKIAKQFNGELIACDSRQVYKGLDIGTGKLPGLDTSFSKHKGYWMIDGVKVWLYDVVNPDVRFTVADYIKEASKIVTRIISGGKLPIIVGGTGLYFKGLLEGFPNLNIPIDSSLREELESLSVNELQQKLKKLSLKDFNKLNNSDRNNKRRLLRSIELIIMNPYKQTRVKNLEFKNWDIFKVGLTTSRDELNKRIDLRLDSRISGGMIEEAEDLNKRGLSFERMRDLGLEYKYLAEYLEGKLNIDNFKSILKTKIHQYAKRQMTWFKRDQEIMWFDVLDKDFSSQVEKYILDWYNRK